MPAAQRLPIETESQPDVKVLHSPKDGRFVVGNSAKTTTTRRELIGHALAFARAAFAMLEEFKAARKFEDGACVPDALREEAANARKADAACLFSMTKAWDSALERHRVLKGSPLPGSRRPTDPPPKIVKPKNKPPA